MGDYRSIDEIEKDLYQQLLQYYNDVQKLSQENPALPESLNTETAVEMVEPEKILAFLQDTITKDFPALTVKDYEVKYVSKAIEEFSSPAFTSLPLLTLSIQILFILTKVLLFPVLSFLQPWPMKAFPVTCTRLFTLVSKTHLPSEAV